MFAVCFGRYAFIIAKNAFASVALADAVITDAPAAAVSSHKIVARPIRGIAKPLCSAMIDVRVGRNASVAAQNIAFTAYTAVFLCLLVFYTDALVCIFRTVFAAVVFFRTIIGTTGYFARRIDAFAFALQRAAGALTCKFMGLHFRASTEHIVKKAIRAAVIIRKAIIGPAGVDGCRIDAFEFFCLAVIVHDISCVRMNYAPKLSLCALDLGTGVFFAVVI